MITEAYVEKAEKKSWHPIVWPHPERIAPEMNLSQQVRNDYWIMASIFLSIEQWQNSQDVEWQKVKNYVRI